MSFKIEHNIPQIKKDHGRRKYPFHQMEIEDSFVFEENEPRIRSAAAKHGRRYNKKFSIYRMPNGTYRCWRIA